MNIKQTKRYFLIALLGAIFTIQSCDESGTDDVVVEDGYGYDFTEVISTYVDDVVITTYTDMKDAATTLYNAAKAYESDQSSGLSDVSDAWRAMRIPWEKSEGFLFGPAALLSLDPSLDSWPLDKTQIQSIIDSDIEISTDAIASSNVHGFHTIEYLIFEDGAAKSSTLSEREIQYLVVAAEYLRNDTYSLWANWIGEDDIDDQTVASVLEENEIEVMYDFASQFKDAGNAGSTFTTQSDAIDQIIDGCIDIASEVGAQKIGGPYGTANTDYDQAVLEVESWYSYNSLTDYKNNITSIKNSYFGAMDGSSSNQGSYSISEFVESKDSELNTKVSDAIDAAIDAINSISPQPFRDAIEGGNNSTIDAAMTACTALEEILTEIKGLRD